MSTRVIFLGGLGEVGRNMFVLEADERLLVIDAGLSFPNEEMLGVDLVLPDFSYVRERAERCEGVILTHGHEDHVGALVWLLKDVPVPVYGTPLTLGLARRRLGEHDVKAKMVAVTAPGSRRIGPFKLRFIPVSHSIPDAMGLAIDTSDGRIVYTGDFKLDDSPIDGRVTDLAAFSQLGDEGVDLLLSDSTNAESPGRTPSERVVGETLRRVFKEAKGRVLVACFASNLHRVQQVCEVAEEAGRRVAFVGRSMIANTEVGRELGHLEISDATLIDVGEVSKHPPSDTVIVCTGSQGEPLSALSLIAAGDHQRVKVEAGDTVILSASPIPGNESAVHRVLNSLYRAGADVFHGGTDRVHVSGHGGSDELAEMLTTVSPRHFVPVHGEYRHLALHAKLAKRLGVVSESISIVEDGDVLELDDGRLTRGDSVPSGIVMVDGIGVGDVGPIVLRDRRVLSEDGVLICVVTIDSHNGEVLAGPDLISRGFVHIESSRHFLEEAAERVADALDTMEDEHVTDWGAIKKTCRKSLGEYAWREIGRRPMVLPIIMEV